MSDLCSGVLLLVSIMTLIFFGPELWKILRKKVLPCRRKHFRRSRSTLRRGLRVRSRKVNLFSNLAHS